MDAPTSASRTHLEARIVNFKLTRDTGESWASRQLPRPTVSARGHPHGVRPCGLRLKSKVSRWIVDGQNAARPLTSMFFLPAGIALGHSGFVSARNAAANWSAGHAGIAARVCGK